MKLLLFEWKKMISGKILLITMLLFILNFGTYYIYMIPSMTTSQDVGMQEWEEEQEAKAIEDYGVFISQMKERAEQMGGISIFNKAGSFSQRNIEKTIKDFEGLEQLALEPQSENGMRRLHDFYLTDLFLILFVCLVCFQEYGKDAKSGMGNLIQVTPKGKGWLRAAQMEAIGFSIVVVGILFYGLNLLLTEWCIGFGKLTGYVQAMPMFRNVSFPCIVGTYLLLFVLWKIAALLVISVILQFFAVLFGGNKVSWIVSGVLLVASFGLWFFVPDSPEAKFFRYLNPAGFLDARQILGNYQNLNLFGYPVNLLHAAIFTMAAIGFVMIVLVVIVKRREFGGIKIEIPAREKRRVWKKTFSYEFYKVFVNQKAWCVLLALLLVSVYAIETGKKYVPAKDYYYENQIAAYEGEYTYEKKFEIRSAWKKQAVTEEGERLALERLYEQSKHLTRVDSENKGFVNLRVMDAFFMDKSQEMQNMIYIVIALMLSLSTLFYMEKKKEMEHLLHTSPQNKEIYWNKMKVAALLGGVYALIVWGITYFKFFKYFELGHLGFSVQSIPGMETLWFDMSILEYMIVAMLLRIVIGVYLGILIGVIVQMLAVPTQNIIFSLLVFVMPLCVSYIGQMQYENPLIEFIRQYLAPVLKPVEYLASFPTAWFAEGVPMLVVWAAIPVAGVCWGYRRWELKL